MKVKNIGIITSGGDSPGMNAAIKSIVEYSYKYGIKCYAYFFGYKGLILNNYKILSIKDVSNIINIGGTTIGTGRSNIFKIKKGREIAYNNLLKNNIDALIIIGGNGSFYGASLFNKEYNFPIIGIPGTIDNDIYGTDLTLGYDTALNSIINNVENIRCIANSNNRVFIIEVMGKNTGFLAKNSGIALGTLSTIYNNKYNIKKIINSFEKKKIISNIIIVAENKYIGNASKIIYKKIKKKSKLIELRHTILGYIQRGNSPSYIDRVVGILFGKESVKKIIKNINNIVLGIKNNKIVEIKIKDSIKKNKKFKKNNIYL